MLFRSLWREYVEADLAAQGIVEDGTASGLPDDIGFAPTSYEARVASEVERREQSWAESQPPKKKRFTDTDAYRRTHPLPKKPPKPWDLAKKISAFANRAESVVGHLPRRAGSSVRRPDWKSGPDYPVLVGLNRVEIEDLRRDLQRTLDATDSIRQWAHWALARIDQIVGEDPAEEEADAHRKADLSILD